MVVQNVAHQSSAAYKRGTTPSMGLDVLFEVLEKVRRNLRNSGFSSSELAQQLGLSSNSSALRGRITSMRLFGLSEPISHNKDRLTQLGRDLTQAAESDRAKKEAFLFVPLFANIHAAYDGKELPTDDVLDRMISSWGVRSTAHRRNIIKVFRRSSKFAGFWIGPFVSNQNQRKSQVDVNDSTNKVDGRSEFDSLFDSLPDVTEEWPLQKRATWLRALAAMFDVFYGEEGTISIEFKKNTGFETVDTLFGRPTPRS